MKNPSYIATRGTEDTTLDIFSVLLGKYVKRTDEDSSSAADNETIVYIPSRSTFGQSKVNNRVYYYAEESTIKLGTKYFDNRGSWEIIKANLETAYPLVGELNGYEYNYIGNPLKDWQNQCKIYYGDYTGTGTGEVQLNFPFQPKFVVVAPERADNTEYGNSIFAINYTKTYSSFYVNAGTGGSWYSTSTVNFIWGEKSFSFSWKVSTSGSTLHLNSVNTQYHYIALG